MQDMKCNIREEKNKMITGVDVNGKIMELTCDICGTSFDDEDEMNEFICFDFVMGEKSLSPYKQVKFDVCQDCFVDAFPSQFDNLFKNDINKKDEDTFSNE